MGGRWAGRSAHHCESSTTKLSTASLQHALSAGCEVGTGAWRVQTPPGEAGVRAPGPAGVSGGWRGLGRVLGRLGGGIARGTGLC